MCDKDGAMSEAERESVDRGYDTDADELSAPENDERCYPDGSVQNECWNPEKEL